MVKALSTGAGLQLHWIQPSMLERRFELYAENRLSGELRIDPNWSANGTLTVPGFPTERWTFQSKGILKTRMTIRDAGTNDILAVYLPKFWGGGQAAFVNGSRFYWKSNSFWGTERGFYNERNEPLLVLKRKQRDLFKIQSAVKIEAQYHDLEELPLLLMLACYLSVQTSYASR
jgi:hypothetical protein